MTQRMEDLGFEPRNPKERIYSPSRLASSLILHNNACSYIRNDKYLTESGNKKQAYSGLKFANLQTILPLRHEIGTLPFMAAFGAVANRTVQISDTIK